MNNNKKSQKESHICERANSKSVIIFECFKSYAYFLAYLPPPLLFGFNLLTFIIFPGTYMD